MTRHSSSLRRVARVLLVPALCSAPLIAQTPDEGADCLHGFVGDTTLAGGWSAFESASGLALEVLASPYADFDVVPSLPTSSGDLLLEPAHEKRTVGASWGSWSHGYLGEVFRVRAAPTTLFTMPEGTRGFDCYVEPSPFAIFTFTCTGFASDGSSEQVSFSADGRSGASHFGFYTDPGCPGLFLEQVEVSLPADWAIGELRVSANIGENYCTVNPSSTGLPARMSAHGGTSIASADFHLAAQPVPDRPFVFFYGPNQVDLPFGNGRLCVAGGLTRLYPPATAVAGRATRSVDLAAQGIAPGTLYFQCWFRDPAGGGAFFNTSDGLCVAFTP